MPIGAGCARAVLTATVLAALLTGCGGNGPSEEPAPTAQSAAPDAEPEGGFDVGRLTEATGIFPADYTTTGMPKEVLSREEADQLAGMHSATAMVYQPPECRSIADPLRITEGSQTAGLRSVRPQSIAVLAARTPLPSPGPLLSEGCTKVKMTSPGAITGVAETIPAPKIPGVETMASKTRIEGSEGGAPRATESYTFVAVLSPQTLVMVQGAENPELLGGVLVKAVAAVRG